MAATAAGGSAMKRTLIWSTFGRPRAWPSNALASTARPGVHEFRHLVDLPREDEVLGRERLAIVPGEVRAQPVRRLHAAVREDAPALGVEARQLLRQIRGGILAAVDVVQRGVEQARGV